MSRYIRIASRFWTDEKVIKLSEQEKFLYLYILTSPHSNMLGFYVLPKLYAMHDLGWNDEQFTKPFTKLLEKGLIKYDETTSVILIPNFLRYNPIQNINQAKGAAKALQELPDNPLFPLFFQCLKRFAEPFMKPFQELLPERYGNTETETETETEECIQSAPAEPTKHKADQQAIFDHWNQQGIIKHRTLNDKIKRAISGALRDYSVDEIKQAISNYAEILRGEQYYFSYKWTLKHFLQRGLEQFLEWKVCSKNYARGDPMKDASADLDSKYADIYIT